MRTLAILLFILINIPALAGTFDHTAALKGPYADGPDVTRACLTCHADAGKDILTTTHWLWAGKPNLLAGSTDNDTPLGKRNLINNFCISVEGGTAPNNKVGCTKCHIGFGWVDDSFDFTNAENIDCLVCHTQDFTYFRAKKLGRGGMLSQSVMSAGRFDLTKAAQSVGKPTRKNCGTCHFYGGGNNNVRHGDLGAFLGDPSRDVDVHMGSGLVCQDCHTFSRHTVAGAASTLATFTSRVDCTTCHEGVHAENKELASHVALIACQTCHIPAFARTDPTLLSWDWSTSGKNLEIEEQFGMETYADTKGTFVWGMNVKPTLAWYNGTTKRYKKGDPVNTTGRTVIAAPVGKKGDGVSKLAPFKVHTGKQPYDAKFGYLLIPHTPGGYWAHLDWQKALRDGAEGSGLPYSGTFGFAETEQWFAINHEVAPKEQALTCSECHKK